MANTKKNYENKVTVTGVVKEFEVKELVAKASGIPMLMATWKIQTGEGEVHTLNQMAMEYFVKDGTKNENAGYKAIQTLQAKIVSVKDIAEDSIGQYEGRKPSVVRATGGMEANVYKGKDGMLKETVRLNARYVTELTDYNEEDFKAEFKLQVFFLTKPTYKTVNDEETEDVQFKAANIDYREMANPFAFEANNEYGVADWMVDNIELGQTATLSGVIQNVFITREVERPNPTGIGKPIVDIERKTLNRILVEGIIPIEDEDHIDHISADVRKKAVELYEAKKVEVQSAETKSDSVKGVQTAKSTPKPSSVVNADDLPF